MHQRPQAGVS